MEQKFVNAVMKYLKKINKENFLKFLINLIKSPIFYITLAAIIIDIVSKRIVAANIALHHNVTIIPNFIHITLDYNTKGIFGLGSDSFAARVLLVVFRALIAVILPIVYLIKCKNLKKRYKVTIMLIYAGCIGNLFDGIFNFNQGVIDWICFDFNWFPYIFNLADSYVTVCVFLIIIFLIVDEIKELINRNRRGEFTMTPEEYEKHLKEQNEKNNNSKQSN